MSSIQKSETPELKKDIHIFNESSMLKNIKELHIANKIHFFCELKNVDGKKKPYGLPVNWTRLTQSSIRTNQNAIIILTGEYNDLTIVDFDDIEQYKKVYYALKELNISTRDFYVVKSGKGYHWYFNYTDQLKTGNSIIPDVEIKNNNASINGYGSWHPVAQKYYTLNQGDILDLPDMPQELINILKPKAPEIKPLSQRVECEDDNEAQLREKLSLIQADDYDTWLKVGIVCYNLEHRNQLTDGLEIWDDWSKTSDSYQEKACNEKWRTFHDQDAQLGWTYINEQIKDIPEYKEIVSSYHTPTMSWTDIKNYEISNNKDAGLVQMMIVNYMNTRIFWLSHSCLVGEWSKNEYGDDIVVERRVSDARNNFSNLHINIPVYVEEAKKSAQKVYAFNLWMESIKRKEYSSTIFNPELYREDGNFLNLYKGMKHENSGECATEDHAFFDHIFKIWCDEDEELYNYILNWFAFIVQNPGKKTKVALVLKSNPRAGKGIIINLIREMIGMQYCFQPTNVSEILGNFNKGLDNKLFLFLDEMVWGGDKEKSGILKKYITEDELTINAKNKSVKVIKNMFNVVIASNEAWVVPNDVTEQRYQVIQLRETMTKLPAAERTKTIDDILSIDLHKLYAFFNTRDISEFTPRNIIKTEAFIEQALMSMDPFHKWLDYIINDFEMLEDDIFEDKINGKVLFNNYSDYLGNKFVGSPTTFHANMRTFGLVYKAVKINGRTNKGYFLLEDELNRLWKSYINN